MPEPDETNHVALADHVPEEEEDIPMDQRVFSFSTKVKTSTVKDDPIVPPQLEAPVDTRDPWCDPSKPLKVEYQDVTAAAFKIKAGIMRTPCTRSHLSHSLGMEIYFKKDFLQYTGSFKERGARYTLLMLSNEQRRVGVIAASAGNHALALCYHGKMLDIPVTVVMPTVAPMMKIQSCKSFGATVVVTGQNLSEAKDYAMKLGTEKGLTYINGYDHPHIIAGQGTLGLEMVEQVPDFDAAIIPIGGGGMIAGVAVAIKSLNPKVQIIGVQTERCPSFLRAMQAGAPIFSKPDNTLADGLAVPLVGVNSFYTAKDYIDKIILVREEYIAISILRLIEVEKAVVEGAGCVGLAAIIQGLVPELKGKKVIVPLCGGNIDTTILGRCLERGLAADGRLIKFTVNVSDRPGGIAELTGRIASIGVTIKDIIHERAWLKNDIFCVTVKCLCETRDRLQAEELETLLRSHYREVHFTTIAF